ncbi:histidine kinase [Pseudonocardia hispaniensis]|uniref:histidine kinase n=1 Tax=Pseudonocardia hispaniensis TaxID=904933 RepID=A0ABW1IYC2_9PSEU
MVWPRASALLVCGGAAVVVVGGAALLVRWPDTGVMAPAVTAAVVMPSVLLGLVLALRRPRNRVAPLLCLIGAVPLLVVGLGDLLAEIVARHPDALLGIDPMVFQGSWMWLYVPPALLMLTFPDGRLPTPRWRWVVVGLLAVPALFTVLGALDPDRYPITVLLGIALLPIFLGLLVASAAGMIVRYRRGDTVVRAQVRWLALGAMLLPITLLLCWLSYLLLDGPDLVVVGLVLTYLAVPVATTVALLRHNLYDVDRAFSTTVTYSLVSAALLAVFSVAAILGGLLLGRDSAVAAAVATALAALVLAPLRSRLQRQVDRRLYPLRQAVLSAVAALRERIDAGRAQPEELEETLRTVLRDPGLRVGYVLPGEDDLVDGQGRPVPERDAAVAVHLGGTRVGALLPSGSGASRELLREVAAASALLVELIRSRLEINAALREVAQSRSRLLQAGYQERKRLERDLHDGAQQRLVSLGMVLRLAQRHLADGTVDIDGLLDQAVAELGTAVAELRAIAHGLRPADLDSGLGPALKSLVTGIPIAVHLEVCAQPMPDDVAATAYYVASEALANVVKHAEAERIELRVAHEDDRLLVCIRDDGCGGARPRPGSGLSGLVDRVAAAGGRLAVADGVPRGTVVEAVLPCAR